MEWTRRQLPDECTVYPKEGVVKIWMEGSTLFEKESPFILPKLTISKKFYTRNKLEKLKIFKAKIFKEMSPLAKRLFGDKFLDIEYSTKERQVSADDDDDGDENEDLFITSSEHVTWVIKEFIFIAFINFENIFIPR